MAHTVGGEAICLWHNSPTVKIKEQEVNSFIWLKVHNFLTDNPQQIFVGKSTTTTILSISVSHGCVHSPLLKVMQNPEITA